jgi:hypothetical protein
MQFRPNSHWGPHLWGFIHTITIIDYQESNERYNKNVKDILVSLYDCFPCPSCKGTYKKFLERLDYIDMKESMGLFFWSVDLHNEVNTKLGKPIWPYDMALNKWSKKID